MFQSHEEKFLDFSQQVKQMQAAQLNKLSQGNPSISDLDREEVRRILNDRPDALIHQIKCILDLWEENANIETHLGITEKRRPPLENILRTFEFQAASPLESALELEDMARNINVLYCHEHERERRNCFYHFQSSHDGERLQSHHYAKYYQEVYKPLAKELTAEGQKKERCSLSTLQPGNDLGRRSVPTTAWNAGTLQHHLGKV